MVKSFKESISNILNADIEKIDFIYGLGENVSEDINDPYYALYLTLQVKLKDVKNGYISMDASSYTESDDLYNFESFRRKSFDPCFDMSCISDYLDLSDDVKEALYPIFEGFLYDAHMEKLEGVNYYSEYM